MRVMTSKYEISSKNHICSVQTFSFRGIIYLPEKKFIGTSSILTWDKSSLLPTDFVFTLEWLFSFSFNSCIYLRSKIYRLIWLFVTIVKSTRWSVNLSPSHSYFSFGIICGWLQWSLAVKDHLRSILKIICSLVIITGVKVPVYFGNKMIQPRIFCSTP